MSGAPNDDELDYLLSRGMLSGAKRAEILERAIASSRPTAPATKRWRRLVAPGAGLAAAAGAALVVVLARPSPHEVARLRTKGSGAGAPILELTCVGARLKACPRGSLLAVSAWNPGAERAPVAGFVSAYADPTPSGERIWYLVNEPLVKSVVPTVARIGSEHRTGSYRAEVVLSRLPLPRAEVLAAQAAPSPEVTARAEFQLEVLP